MIYITLAKISPDAAPAKLAANFPVREPKTQKLPVYF